MVWIFFSISSSKSAITIDRRKITFSGEQNLSRRLSGGEKRDEKWRRNWVTSENSTGKRKCSNCGWLMFVWVGNIDWRGAIKSPFWNFILITSVVSFSPSSWFINYTESTALYGSLGVSRGETLRWGRGTDDWQFYWIQSDFNYKSVGVVDWSRDWFNGVAATFLPF